MLLRRYEGSVGGLFDRKPQLTKIIVGIADADEGILHLKLFADGLDYGAVLQDSAVLPGCDVEKAGSKGSKYRFRDVQGRACVTSYVIRKRISAHIVSHVDAVDLMLGLKGRVDELGVVIDFLLDDAFLGDDVQLTFDSTGRSLTHDGGLHVEDDVLDKKAAGFQYEDREVLGFRVP